MADNNQYDRPRVFVPVAVQALVVNQPVQNGIPFARWQMNYDNLQQLDSPMPRPFESLGDKPKLGVHLHWVLPDALTHGRQKELFSIDSTVPEYRRISDDLDQATVSTALRNQFQANGWPLSSDQIVVVIEVESTRWLIIDANHTQSYEVNKRTDSEGQQRLVISTGAIDFPLVPNRWLVARFMPGPNPTDKHTLAAWVILSDHLDPNKGSNPFLNPFSTAPEKTMLGTFQPLESWSGETSGQALFLKALGPGDVTFARYTPGVRNVFAFHDDTTQLPSGTKLTYMVMGWYSDPTKDPLYEGATKDKWQALMDDLKWRVDGAVSDSPPNQCCFHGLIYEVDWQTHDIPPRPNGDASQVAQNVRVAVGHTAIDALAALVEKELGTVPRLAELLEAFQYNFLSVLDKPGGATELGQRIHQAWFSSEPGGASWEIVEKERADTEEMQDPVQIPIKDRQWLAELNRQQQELDNARRKLASLQWELYATWWKQKKSHLTDYQPQYPPDDYDVIKQKLSDALDTTKPDSLINRVIAERQAIVNQARKLPNPNDPISIMQHAASQGLAAGLQLKPAARPRFWRPNDPVVLVQGLGFTNKQDPREPLRCRLPGQTTTGIAYGGKQTTAQQMQTDIPIPSNTHLPKQLTALSEEVFFIDPGNAAIIAKALGISDVQGLANAIQNRQGLIGPAPNAFAIVQWSQAWSPLFLDWMVRLYPTVKKEDQRQFDLTGWMFTGQDFDWNGGDVIKYDRDQAYYQSYTGRTFLTPQVAFNFGERLKQYLKNQPNTDLQKLEDFLDQVAKWDFLSQTLSGFSELLIMRNPEQNLAPDAKIVAHVGEHYRGLPDVYRGDVDTSFGEGPPFFFPIRGGFFQFEKLMMVDAFGQVVDLICANGNPPGGKGCSPDAFKPIRARGLAPDSTSSLTNRDQMLKLAPRLVQAGQLDFRFLSAENDQDETGLTVGANPVCGWLLPNYLDQALSVYDAEGQPLGELSLIWEGPQKSRPQWTPAPESPAAAPTPDDVKNAHLRKLVSQLIEMNQGQGQAFENLLQVIDETLWTVNPLGRQGDQTLSVLIGRPIAVVRAKLRLILAGDPVRNQSWAAAFEPDDGGIAELRFPVKLGNIDLRNDGLMGYYLGDDYTKFNSVHYPKEMTPATPPYIYQIGQNNDYLALQFNAESAAYITMLLEPRGQVHASTGILPVNALSLPTQYFESVLTQMQTTFRTGPLLVEPETIRMPRPAEHYGAWSWVQRTGTGETDWTEAAIVKADEQARLLDAPLTLRDGWLKLSRQDDGDHDSSLHK